MRARPDDGRVADRAQVSAARHHPALRSQLQRLQRADHPARAVEQHAVAGARYSTRARTSSVPSSRRSPAPPMPSPYGGKVLQVQVDLDQDKLQAYGLSVAGRRRTRSRGRTSSRQSEPRRSATSNMSSRSTTRRARSLSLNDLPIKTVDGATVFIHDVAFAHAGEPAADQHGAGRRRKRRPDDHPEDRLRFDARRHRRRQGAAAEAASDPALKPSPRGGRRPVEVRHLGGVDSVDLRGRRGGGA